MSAPFYPYEAWLDIPAGEQPPSYYRLLGLATFEPDHATIERAARQQLARIQKLAAAEHAALAKVIAEQIVAARNILLSPGARQIYDRSLAAPRPQPRHCHLRRPPQSRLRRGRGHGGVGWPRWRAAAHSRS